MADEMLKLLHMAVENNVPNSDGYTASMIAACFGRAAALDTLLPSFPDLSVQGPRGETALIAACANNQYSVVQKLMNHAQASPDDVFLTPETVLTTTNETA